VDQDKILNPVSRTVINDGNNNLGDFIPKIIMLGDGAFRGFGISAKLPEKACKKWLGHIVGNERLRKLVIEELQNIFGGHVFYGQSYLRIRWSPRGVTFETDGENGCYVAMSDLGVEFSYTYHNIDTLEQAMVLYLSLSIWLPRLWFYLDRLESGHMNSKDFTPLTKDEYVLDEIVLPQVPECQMLLEQCQNKYSRICHYCTRNPKFFSGLQDNESKRVGDKYEPPGGLEGKELCPVCGANITALDGKCPYCDE